jgi:hypothetical protein
VNFLSSLGDGKFELVMPLLRPPRVLGWKDRGGRLRGVVKLSTTNFFDLLKKVALQIGIEISPMLARDMERSGIRRKVDEPIRGRSSVKHKSPETFWMCLD